MSNNIENKIGFCLKCKEKREISNSQEIITKNKKRAVTGVCPVCGTKMFKFLSSKTKEEEPESEMSSFDESGQ